MLQCCPGKKGPQDETDEQPEEEGHFFPSHFYRRTLSQRREHEPVDNDGNQWCEDFSQDAQIVILDFTFHIIQGQPLHKIEVGVLFPYYNPYGFHLFFTIIAFIVVELYNLSFK